MRRGIFATFVVSVCVLLTGALAYAQGGGATSSLAGVVVDSGGGVIPGATVVVTNRATNVATETVTNTAGLFSVPALDPGTYTVRVALTGFKTAIINDVRLLAATPSDVKVMLEVGSLSETVNVSSRAELVQTQSSTISSTISSNQIMNLPLVTRNALDFVTYLPGVSTTSQNRDATVNGLPQAAINITIDGVNVQDNFNKTGDGFFAIIRPQLDQIEEVTVTGATPGAATSGQGAVQIAFVTRSGTNEFASSVYHYFRHPSLNTNYWFNERNGLDKNKVILHQYGGRIGGPIIIPGLFNGRNKAFFFVNHEEFYQPTEASVTRTIMHPLAQQGVFRYTAGGATREVNVLDVAARSGQVATPDPVIAALLAKIQQATTTAGVVTQLTDLNTQSYFHQAPGTLKDHSPRIRLDVNLSDRHRLSGTYSYQRAIQDPDLLNNVEPRFPGFANFRTQDSHRNSGSLMLRSTYSTNIVNEARFGFLWAPVNFGANLTPAMFEDQGGFSLTLGNVGNTLTNATTTTAFSARNASDWNIDNTLNWQKGRHSLQFGGNFTQINVWVTDQTQVPTVQLGLDTSNDPANGMFNTTNFPGASTAQLNNARQLYAILTGRVTAINGNARLNEDTNEYSYLGRRTRRGRMNEFGLFAQDSWRVTPALTLNGGLRWELQLPFQPLNDVFSMATMSDVCGVSGAGNGPGGRACNLFSPGTLAGRAPAFVQYDSGNPGYDTDWNNFAPNAGFAWRPNVQHGVLRTILGDPEQATIRGGFAVAFTRNGIGDFTGVYGGNPGSELTANRNTNNDLLVRPGETWPLLFRDSSRLGAPPIPVTPEYPLASTIDNDINIFDPAIEVTSSRSWTIGIQRALSDDMAVELRYVGTRNRNGWTTENWNELNLIETGFIDEFRRAQANLIANNNSGVASRAGSFAYFGPGTGTAPLPIYLAFFSGVPAALADQASRYTSANFRNTAWTGHLALFEPDPADAANDLYNNAGRRSNAADAGLPRNFFVLNPDADDVNVTRSASGSKYHALQVELRRRLAQGLRAQVNYSWARRYGTQLDTLRRPRSFVLSNDVRHSLKMDWFYEIPVGRGRRFGTNMNPWMNGLVGDWEFNGTGRVQSGDVFSATGVKLVGMSEKELRDAFKIRFAPDDTGRTIVYLLPQDIIDNTRRAFNTDPNSPTGYGADGPPTGRFIAPESGPDCIALEPGDCTGRRTIFVFGPIFTRFDMSLRKRFPLRGRANFEVTFEMLNVFDNVNFNSTFNPGSGATIFQTNSAFTDLDNTFDPGGRLGQIVTRLSW